MTLFVGDFTAYQGSLTPADFARAQFDILSWKTSHGLGLRAVRAGIAAEVADTRARGLGVGSSHFLTGDATGAAQADHAWRQLQTHGLTEDASHQADAEENTVGPDVTLPIVREYIDAMQQRLQRHVALYSGAWFWRPRGWDVSDLTPFYWAAPTGGYLGAYPGDDSSHWAAGYGGWAALSLMQYAVNPLVFPDGTAGTIKVSKTAIRDEAVWAALTGGTVAWYLNPALSTLRAEVNRAYPSRDKASDGTIADAAHPSTSDHQADPDGSVDAWDMDVELNGVGKPYAADVEALKLRFQQHPAARYWIHDRVIASRSTGWRREAYTGTNPHDRHVHFNTREEYENSTQPWGIEDDVSAQDVIDALKSQAGKDALWEAIAKRDVIQGYDAAGVAIPENPADPGANSITALTVLTRAGRLATMLTPDRVLALTATTGQIPALLAAVKADDVDEAALAAQITAALVPAVTAAVVAELGERAGLTGQDVEDAAGRAVRAVLGGLDVTGT